MLRQAVATLLRADGTLPGLLTGGIWPDDTHEAAAMARDTYPAAFDAGEILPTAMVQDDGMFRFGDAPGAVSDTFSVLCWQQRGRGTIAAALTAIYAALEGTRVVVSGAWVYEIRFAGEGPSVRDQALGDAEYGWSRWQAVMVRG